MCSLALARDARASWALHKIALLAGDGDGAREHLTDAQTLATASGIEAYSEGAAMSAIFADVELLAVEWKQAFDTEAYVAQAEEWAEEWAEEQRDQPQIVWFGNWYTLDGLYETRPSVATLDGKFLPGLEVSQSGGDCEPNYGAPCDSLEAAKSAAVAMQSNWHFADCEDA
jgi:hypothetical protein